MEPATGDLLNQKPRDPKEPILNGALLGKIFAYGILIAAAVMGAYFTGLNAGGAGLAMTMAFATLTLARLFHGFNCRGLPSIFRIGLTTNKASIGAFFAGVMLLAAVLFIPGLNGLFEVTPMSGEQLGLVVLLAFLPTVVIQIYKVINDAVRAARRK